MLSYEAMPEFPVVPADANASNLIWNYLRTTYGNVSNISIYIYIYPPTPGGGTRQRTLLHPGLDCSSEDAFSVACGWNRAQVLRLGAPGERLRVGAPGERVREEEKKRFSLELHPAVRKHGFWKRTRRGEEDFYCRQETDRQRQRQRQKERKTERQKDRKKERKKREKQTERERQKQKARERERGKEREKDMEGKRPSASQQEREREREMSRYNLLYNCMFTPS